MSVRPEMLETPETDLRLANRDARKPTAGDALRDFYARIEAARKLEPQGHELHCRDCFNRGRDAAIRAIEGIQGK